MIKVKKIVFKQRKVNTYLHQNWVFFSSFSFLSVIIFLSIGSSNLRCFLRFRTNRRSFSPVFVIFWNFFVLAAWIFLDTARNAMKKGLEKKNYAVAMATPSFARNLANDYVTKPDVFCFTSLSFAPSVDLVIEQTKHVSLSWSISLWPDIKSRLFPQSEDWEPNKRAAVLFSLFFFVLAADGEKKIPTKIGKWHGISLILKLVFQLLFAILFTFNTYPFFIHWKTRLTESYMEDKTESRQIFPMQLHLSYHTLAYTSISPC